MARLVLFNRQAGGIPVAPDDNRRVYLLIGGTRRPVESEGERDRIIWQHAEVKDVQSMTTDMKKFYPLAT